MTSPGLQWVLGVVLGTEPVPAGADVRRRFVPSFFDGLPARQVIATLYDVRTSAVWEVAGTDTQSDEGRERALIVTPGDAILISTWPDDDPEVLRGLLIDRLDAGLTPWASFAAAASVGPLTSVRHDERLPGVALAVGRDGAVSSSSAGVQAPGAPLTGASRFRAGAVSRAVTALAALRLSRAGSLDLDAPIPDGLVDAAGVTPRHLLTHTAGLVVDAPAGAPVPVGGPVGQAVAPSNAGYAVLGTLLAGAGAAPFAELARTLVLDPAGMEASSIEAAPALVGWNRLADRLWATPAEAVDEAAGGLVTTASDLALLGAAVLAEPELLVPQHERGIAVARGGLGLHLGAVGEHRIALATGGIADAWKAVLLLDPARGVVVAALANTHPARLEKLAADTLRAL